MNNIGRYPNCSMRTEIGNCDPIGGFCTSVNENICDALHKVSRPKGEWVGLAECSVCGKQADDFIDGYVDGLEYLPKYCPNCGARMKGGAE